MPYWPRKPWLRIVRKRCAAIPTPAVPPGQEGGFVRIEEAAVAAMPRLALGKRRALEVALHGAPTEPDLLRDGIQRPALLMVGPDLLVVGPPAGPAAGGASRAAAVDDCGGASGTEAGLGGCRRTGGIVHAAWARRCAGH